MSRPYLPVPLLVLLVPACTPGGGEASTTTTGFESGQPSTGGPGPSSFGDSGSGSTADTPTTDPTSTTTVSTTSPTTTSTTTASTTDASTTGTTGEPGTTGTTTGTTIGTTTGSSTDTGSSATGEPVCGDGIVDGDEFCDDGNMSDGDACLAGCTAGTAVLALIGVGTQPGVAARFAPDIGWTTEPIALGITEAELETTPDGAMAVVRRASAKPEEQGELYYARWQAQDPALFGMYNKVGQFGFAKDGPSLAAVADTVTLTFLGTDNKHYTGLYTENGWAAFTKLPAGMVQIQAFGPSAAVVVPAAIETYAAYTGDDARIYYSSKASPGGAWQASSGTPPPSVLGPPVGVVDDEGDLILAYVRKNDGKIALVKLLTPQNAWAKEALVHANAITASEIAFIRLAAGSYAIAWRGFDNEGIYLSTGTAYDDWATPVTIEMPALATTKPALVHGVHGADLEVLYGAGGKLRHARVLDGGGIAPVDVPGIAGATSVTATIVQLEP